MSHQDYKFEDQGGLTLVSIRRCAMPPWRSKSLKFQRECFGGPRHNTRHQRLEIFNRKGRDGATFVSWLASPFVSVLDGCHIRNNEPEEV